MQKHVIRLENMLSNTESVLSGTKKLLSYGTIICYSMRKRVIQYWKRVVHCEHVLTITENVLNGT